MTSRDRYGKAQCTAYSCFYIKEKCRNVLIFEGNAPKALVQYKTFACFILPFQLTCLREVPSAFVDFNLLDMLPATKQAGTSSDDGPTDLVESLSLNFAPAPEQADSNVVIESWTVHKASKLMNDVMEHN